MRSNTNRDVDTVKKEAMTMLSSTKIGIAAMTRKLMSTRSKLGCGHDMGIHLTPTWILVREMAWLGRRRIWGRSGLMVWTGKAADKMHSVLGVAGYGRALHRL